jgi:hypothetical protein
MAESDEEEIQAVSPISRKSQIGFQRLKCEVKGFSSNLGNQKFSSGWLNLR